METAQPLLECCPVCQGPLTNKTSKSGNPYQQCPKALGGCGWWSGQKEGEVAPKPKFPQKRNFSVNQGPSATFQAPKQVKPNPQPQAQVVQGKEANSLLLELFRERLQKDEILEGLVKELIDKVQELTDKVEELQKPKQ